MLTPVKKLIQDVKNIIATVNALSGNLFGSSQLATLLLSNLPLTAVGLAIGGTKTAVATAAFDFMIAGKKYSKAVVTAGTALNADTIPQNLFGAFAFEIGTNGTIDVISAAANATGYSTAPLAIAGLPAVQASHARIGTVTVMSTEAEGMICATDNLDEGDATVAYTDATAYLAYISAQLTALTQTTLVQVSYLS